MTFTEHSKSDALGWIAPGAGLDLLPLVPPGWIQSLKDEHLEHRRDHLTHHRAHQWESAVNMGQSFAPVQVISANGEIGFHKDEGFSSYGYLLILRAAGYNVTGPRPWRGLERQQVAGDLICLRQKTHFHALVRHGFRKGECGHLANDWGVVLSERPQRLWIAATLDTPKYLAPDEAVEQYERALKRIPINKFKKS